MAQHKLTCTIGALFNRYIIYLHYGARGWPRTSKPRQFCEKNGTGLNFLAPRDGVAVLAPWWNVVECKSQPEVVSPVLAHEWMFEETAVGKGAHLE